MRHRALAPFSVMLGITLLVAGCGSSTNSGGGTPAASAGTTSLKGESANDHGTKDVSGGGSQDVEVDNFYFNPTVFTGKAGDKLTLTLSNDSKTAHNFSVTEQKIDTDIPVGGKATASVTFPASGTLVFFCKFHRSSGMLGGLKVEAN